MVKRLMLTVLMAAGGTGAYMYGSGFISVKPESTDHSAAATTTSNESEATSEWEVEYVDGEGNPIQHGSGFRGSEQLRRTSSSLLKRISGLTSVSKRPTSN